MATKVHTMSVLVRICDRKPALAPELRLHIEHQLPGNSNTAFRSMARRVLEILTRLEAGGL